MNFDFAGRSCPKLDACCSYGVVALRASVGRRLLLLRRLDSAVADARGSATAA